MKISLGRLVSAFLGLFSWPFTAVKTRLMSGPYDWTFLGRRVLKLNLEGLAVVYVRLMSDDNRDCWSQEARLSQETQLIMSLKLHHAKILSQIPLEVAVSAMTKAWRSCQHPLDRQGDIDIHL